MPTPRKGDSPQAAIALVEGALQVSKPRPVKTEPPTDPVATAPPPRGPAPPTALACAARGRTRDRAGAARTRRGATTIAWCLPRIGPAGQLWSFDGAPR